MRLLGQVLVWAVFLLAAAIMVAMTGVVHR